MDLISQYFDGKVVYLLNWENNEKKISFSVGFPDPYILYSTIIFYDISNFKQDSEVENENDWESIVDLIVNEKHCFLVTDVREVTFRFEYFEINKNYL